MSLVTLTRRQQIQVLIAGMMAAGNRSCREPEGSIRRGHIASLHPLPLREEWQRPHGAYARSRL